MLYSSIEDLIKTPQLIKPIIIVTYNCPTYLKGTLHQLTRMNLDLPIII